jgi:hypothetical protein
MNLPPNYAYAGPFIKQTSQTRVVYDQQYVKTGSRTNEAMAYMRLGWLSAFVPYVKLKTITAVDIGSGGGIMADVFSRVCANVKKYDLTGETISAEELKTTNWDLVILNDVLEHYDNIDDLFSLKWRYCLLSFPETPNAATFEELTKWRHFKPDEHIYHLHEKGVTEWATNLGAEIVAASNFEDILRQRWDPALPNITTMLLRREI